MELGKRSTEERMGAEEQGRELPRGGKGRVSPSRMNSEGEKNDFISEYNNSSSEGREERVGEAEMK